MNEGMVHKMYKRKGMFRIKIGKGTDVTFDQHGGHRGTISLYFTLMVYLYKFGYF